jgi:thiol-disulfide isomerase/thioredoxin
MSDRARFPASLAVVAALVLACGGPVATPTTVPVETPNEPPAQSVAPLELAPSAPSSHSAGSPEPLAGSPGASAVLPVIEAAWAQNELTDVATGEAFRIADLAGRVVIIETMAIWCVNCRAQQGEVYAALDELDPERVAYVLLDVDPNETGPALAEYRSRNGFTGTYAIAGDEVARALASDFGDQVLNPPSTPMILIGADGRVTLTDFGHKPAAAVVRLARDHGA